ncbi:MAG: tyrosine-type recombinase/integrase [Burkholderiales bacterium]|nr:tyrosine-type recombinase/integrase [Burkholderiales bacterium]
MTDAEIRALKPREKPYRMSLGESLYVCVRPLRGDDSKKAKNKSLEYRYKDGGKVRAISLGVFPHDITLKQARDKVVEIKADRKRGLDPIAARAITAEEQRQQLAEAKARRAQERTEAQRERLTFEVAAREWYGSMRQTWTQVHAEQILQSLVDHAFPIIGAKRLDQVTPADVLGVLDRLLAENKVETAMRVRQRIDATCEYAILHYIGSMPQGNPCAGIKREFSKRCRAARKIKPKTNFACVPIPEAPHMLRALASYTGPAGRFVKFCMFSACRSSEARFARWDEIDIGKALWTVPASRMKARKPHVVPLSKQALELLREIKLHSPGKFLFPHPAKADRPLSENAGLVVWAALDLKGRMTTHGLRSLFSTIATESGLWRVEAIEASLAHSERDDVRAAYQRSTFLEERRRLLQWYADELDRLESGQSAKVVKIKARR